MENDPKPTPRWPKQVWDNRRRRWSAWKQQQRVETFTYTDSRGRSRTRSGIHEKDGTYHDLD